MYVRMSTIGARDQVHRPDQRFVHNIHAIYSHEPNPNPKRHTKR